MENTNIEKTINFLKDQFKKSEYMSNNESSKNYRIEHTLRVANIGKQIAMNEGFNVEAMVIGCLLHDISYTLDFNSEDDWLNHGRNAAKIARPFLEELKLDTKFIDEICFGIAIHVDDKADFEGERTPFALTIGDCDNIDRFDVYRIYENLQYKKFDTLSFDDKFTYVTNVIDKLNKYLNLELGTKTAKEIWVEKINYQIGFFEKMKKQLELSKTVQ